LELADRCFSSILRGHFSRRAPRTTEFVIRHNWTRHGIPTVFWGNDIARGWSEWLTETILRALILMDDWCGPVLHGVTTV